MKETMETKEVFLHPKYDVTDFRSEDMKIIEELLKGTDDFRIEIESTKELTNAQIYGKKNGIELRVEWYMDDLCDLIDDALCANEQEVENQEEWNELLNALEDADIHTVCGSGETILRNSKPEEVIRKLGSLSFESYRDLDVEWANCKAIVRDFINARRASK